MMTPTANLADAELLADWLYIEDCDYEAERADEIAAELKRRQVDI